jgi:hypothetical protein
LPRGPPPIRNAKFAELAEEERAAATKQQQQQNRSDNPPPSRFDRADNDGPRFDRRSKFDGTNKNNDDNGPPPVAANSRFAMAAKLAEEEKQTRGPPPQVTNSRFAAAARMAEGENRDRERDRDEQTRGPPPQVTNSRFAAAARMAEGENRDRERDDRRQGNRDNQYSYRENRSNDDRGPLPTNSRFAAAAAADRDYVNRDEREHRRRDEPRDNPRRGGGNRFGDLPRGPGELPKGPGGAYEEKPQGPTRVDELIKVKKEEVVLPPSELHEANMFKIPAKALTKDKDDEGLFTKKKDSVKTSEPALTAVEVAPEVVSIASVSTEAAEELLQTFTSGKLLGEELKNWVIEKRAVLPTVEKLVLTMLHEREKLNPDPECAWAATSKYGAALLELVEDDLFNQMQILWAIQSYCDKLGFPKLDGESIVQSMFRSMYKFDLATDEAFAEWKEDESHEQGKMTAIVQTVDWFNWLEQEEEEEEDEDE